MKYGVVVGRFQTSKLTTGHTKLLQCVSEENDRLIVFLGVADGPPTQKNPLSVAIRGWMILEEFPSATILTIRDHPSDAVWSQQLDDMIDVATEGVGATLYGGRDNFFPYYKGKNSVKIVSFGADHVSATSDRERFRMPTRDLNTWQFRAGVIYAQLNSWHRMYHTVDMALVKRVWGGMLLCLVRKPGETQWQFPGGFVDKGEKFAEAAAREMREETGLSSNNGWDYVDDFMIDDWRVRNVPGVDHKTVLMIGYANYNDEPVANDDVEEAKWFWLDEAHKDRDILIRENHRVLFDRLIEYINDKYKNNA